MALKLHFLGVPRIEVDGQSIHLDRQKSVALLAYLAVTNRPHSRDWLAALLWPDRQMGRTQLRIALSTLRRTLGSACFETNRDEIALSSAWFWSDIDEFRQISAAVLREEGEGALSQSEFETVLALATCDFMEGFTLRDAPEFDSWQRSEAQRLRWTLEQVLEKYALDWIKRGNFEAAIAATRQRVAVDPVNEEACRLLMTLYTWTNRRPLAVQAYQRLKDWLEAEIGLEPEVKTTALFQTIQTESEIQFPYKRVASQLPLLGSLFGREDAIQTLMNKFAHGARLVTIVGPGGVGKTHLAVEVAQRLKPQFAEGCYFLRLEENVSSEFLVSALIDTLQQYSYTPEQARDSLIAYLRTRSVLLVIDNFHHVTGGERIIQWIVQQAPGVRFLITSYDALDLTLEHRYPLHGLPDVHESGKSAAVALFVETACRVVPTFRLTPENQALIRRICQLVLGMPLGIILAASWCDTLSVAEITAEIEMNYDFLRINHHDLPERHHSLRSVFDTVWLRLTPEEQNALMRLSVFPGSFSRAAAKGVADVRLPLLKGLVVKSLVTHHGQEQRYTLHDIYRQYAREKLAGHPDAQTIWSVHCQYFTDFVIEHSAQIKGRLQYTGWREIDAELTNIRAAWAYAVDTQDYERLNRLIEPLALYLQTRGLWEQGVLLFDQARQQVIADSDLPAARLMQAKLHSRLYRDLGSVPTTLEAALQAALELGDEAEVAHIRAELGWHFLTSDRYALAKDHLSVALQYHRQQGEHYYTALILRGLAYCAIGLRDRAEMVRCMNESLRLRRTIGDVVGEHETLLLRGEIALLGGDLAAATSDLQAVYRYIAANFNEQLAMQENLALVWLLTLTGEWPHALQLVEALEQVDLNLRPGPLRGTIDAVRLLIHLAEGSEQVAGDLARLENTLETIAYWNLNPDLRFLAESVSLLANAALGKRDRALHQLRQLDAHGYFTHPDYLAWIAPGALLLAEPVPADLLGFFQNSPLASFPWFQTWAWFQQRLRELKGCQAASPNRSAEMAFAELARLPDH